MNSNASGLARARLFAAASSLALGMMLTSPVLAAQDETAFDIPAQPLSDAIAEFSRQSRVNVLVPSTVTTGKTSNAVAGEMPADEALRLLIGGTELNVSLQNDGAFLISAVAPEVVQPEKGRSFRVAQLVEETDRDGVTEAGNEPEARKKDEITVTGTLIKGIAPESSPVQVFNRDDIFRSGASSTEDFIRREVPQAFGGGATEYAPVGLPGNPGSGRNNTFGSSANLRGLGQKGTLVLLNGNRMAPTSEIGDFVDISMIPVSALERVDVLTDGASSIYGGDAVAGVINFILRDDFEGSETSVRYGSVTDGDMDEYRASQTVGTAWNSGNLLATYEYYFRDRLRLSDREHIERFTPESTAVQLPDPSSYSLLPEQERHSGIVSASQNVGDNLKLNAAVLYSDRVSSSSSYDWFGAINTFDAKSESVSLSGGAEYGISENWAATLDATYSKISNRSVIRDYLGSFQPDSTEVRKTKSDLWSIDARLNGELFLLPAGAVKLAFGGHFREEQFNNERIDIQLTSDGDRKVKAAYAELLVPLIGDGNSYPGIRELTLNVSGRIEDYSDFGTSADPKIGVVWSPAEGVRIRSSFSTSFAPPPMGTAFDLSRLVGVLPYDFLLSLYGETVPDPSLAGTTFIQVQGVAPNLKPETSRTYTIGFDFEGGRGPHAWSLAGTYYNIEFEDRLGTVPLPSGITNTLLVGHVAWEDPEAFPEGSVIFFPSDDLIAATVAESISTPIIYPGASLDNVGIISNVPLTRNLANVKTDGLDFRVDYSYKSVVGEISAGINLNYIFAFTEQATVTTPAFRTLNTLYKPVDLQARTRIGIRSGGFSANLFGNYLDGYRSDRTASSVAIDSWATFDATLSYEFETMSAPWLEGTVLSLSVSNILNDGPPNTPTRGASNLLGYDPANASPIGRFIAFELRKAF